MNSDPAAHHTVDVSVLKAMQTLRDEYEEFGYRMSIQAFPSEALRNLSFADWLRIAGRHVKGWEDVL